MTLAGEAGPASENAIGRHAAVPALPAVLHEMADVLERTSPDALARHPIGRTYERAVQKAESRLDAATQRLAALRAVARRRRLLTWQRALLVVLGFGLAAGTVLIALLGALYLDAWPLLLLPLAFALGALVFLAARQRGRRAPRPVAGLESAVAEVEDAASVARRARSRAQLATQRWSELSRARRTSVLAWCRRNAVPADADALRQLARRAEDPAGRAGRHRGR